MTLVDISDRQAAQQRSEVGSAPFPFSAAAAAAAAIAASEHYVQSSNCDSDVVANIFLSGRYKYAANQNLSRLFPVLFFADNSRS